MNKKLGRGMTTPMWHYDEFDYINGSKFNTKYLEVCIRRVALLRKLSLKNNTSNLNSDLKNNGLW